VTVGVEVEKEIGKSEWTNRNFKLDRT